MSLLRSVAKAVKSVRGNATVADMGESVNPFYYNEELKQWVEKGKEDEVRQQRDKDKRDQEEALSRLKGRASPLPSAVSTEPQKTMSALDAMCAPPPGLLRNKYGRSTHVRGSESYGLVRPPYSTTVTGRVPSGPFRPFPVNKSRVTSMPAAATGGLSKVGPRPPIATHSAEPSANWIHRASESSKEGQDDATDPAKGEGPHGGDEGLQEGATGSLSGLADNLPESMLAEANKNIPASGSLGPSGQPPDSYLPPDSYIPFVPPESPIEPRSSITFEMLRSSQELPQSVVGKLGGEHLRSEFRHHNGAPSPPLPSLYHHRQQQPSSAAQSVSPHQDPMSPRQAYDVTLSEDRPEGHEVAGDTVPMGSLMNALHDSTNPEEPHGVGKAEGFSDFVGHSSSGVLTRELLSNTRKLSTGPQMHSKRHETSPAEPHQPSRWHFQPSEAPSVTSYGGPADARRIGSGLSADGDVWQQPTSATITPVGPNEQSPGGQSNACPPSSYQSYVHPLPEAILTSGNPSPSHYGEATADDHRDDAGSPNVAERSPGDPPSRTWANHSYKEPCVGPESPGERAETLQSGLYPPTMEYATDQPPGHYGTGVSPGGQSFEKSLGYNHNQNYPPPGSSNLTFGPMNVLDTPRIDGDNSVQSSAKSGRDGGGESHSEKPAAVSVKTTEDKLGVESKGPALAELSVLGVSPRPRGVSSSTQDRADQASLDIVEPSPGGQSQAGRSSPFRTLKQQKPLVRHEEADSASHSAERTGILERDGSRRRLEHTSPEPPTVDGSDKAATRGLWGRTPEYATKKQLSDFPQMPLREPPSLNDDSTTAAVHFEAPPNRSSTRAIEAEASVLEQRKVVDVGIPEAENHPESRKLTAECKRQTSEHHKNRGGTLISHEVLASAEKPVSVPMKRGHVLSGSQPVGELEDLRSAILRFSESLPRTVMSQDMLIRQLEEKDRRIGRQADALLELKRHEGELLVFAEAVKAQYGVNVPGVDSDVLRQVILKVWEQRSKAQQLAATIAEVTERLKEREFQLQIAGDEKASCAKLLQSAKTETNLVDARLKQLEAAFERQTVEMNQLAARNEALQAAMDDKTREFAEAAIEKARLEELLQAKETLLEDRERALEEKEMTLDAAERELEVVQRGRQDAENALKDASLELDRVIRVVEAKESEAAEKELTLSANQQKIDELGLMLEQTQAEVAELKRCAIEVEEKTNSMVSTISAQGQEAQRLAEERSTLLEEKDAEMTALKQQLSQAQEELREMLSRKSIELADAVRVAQEAETSKASLTAELQAAQKQIDQLNENLEEALKLRDEYAQKVTLLEDQVTNNADYANLRRANDLLEEELRKISEELRQKHEEFLRLSEDLAQKTDSLEMTRAALEEHEHAADESNKQVALFKQEIADLQAELDIANEQRSSLESRMLETEATIATRAWEVSSLSEQLELEKTQSSRSRELAQSEIENLQKQIHELQMSVARVESENQKRCEETEGLRLRLEKAQGDLKQSQKQKEEALAKQMEEHSNAFSNFKVAWCEKFKICAGTLTKQFEEQTAVLKVQIKELEEKLHKAESKCKQAHNTVEILSRRWDILLNKHYDIGVEVEQQFDHEVTVART